MPVKARRVMTRKVHCVLPETPVSVAWQLMHQQDIRHLPVTQGGRLVGILSDRDLFGRVLLEKHGSPLFDDTTCGEIMTLNPVVCVQGTPVAEMSRLMVKKHIDALPIVSLDGSLVGLVTSSDLLSLLVENVKSDLPYSFTLSSAQARA